MSSDQLLVSILSYLSGPFKQAASDAESVDIAIQCLTDAAGLDETKKSPLAVPHSLPAIFAAGLAALNNPSSSTSSTSSTTSTTPTNPKYKQFLDLLASKGFFGNATPGSAEYNEKLELAKKKYVAKYGSGSEESKSESKSATPSPSPQPFIPTPVTDAQKAKAEEFKAQGNAHLQAQRYQEAVESYTQAITQNPNHAIYWANRAAAYQHLKQYEKAVTDCRESIRVDPSYAKGHYRLGAALFQLDRTQDAINAYEKALSLSTNDPNMAANIREQLDMARAKLASPNPFGGLGGGAGGMDFASLLNNPAIANIMSSLGAGGGSGPGGLDIGALMSNPAIQQMAQQFMGGMGGAAAAASSQTSSSTSTSSSSSSSSSSSGGGNDFLNNIMSNPEIMALRDDPTLAPVFADVEANGESALYKYLGDPNVMSKLSGVMGKMFGGK